MHPFWEYPEYSTAFFCFTCPDHAVNSEWLRIFIAMFILCTRALPDMVTVCWTLSALAGCHQLSVVTNVLRIYTAYIW